MSEFTCRVKSWIIFPLLSVLFAPSTYANQGLVHERIKLEQSMDADVFQVNDLSQLKLFLNDQAQQPLLKFKNIQKELKACEFLSFAMNAGMYHADYSPVGLYMENQHVFKPLNRDKEGYGNFFMQPNGVLAWNNERAIIQTTEDFHKINFPAHFATQSGPMLLINGQMNPKFLPDSSSLKIRNGVGVKDHTLYFVITRNRVNFYQFAEFFKNKLEVDNALYLDGSISSLYFPQIYREDHRYALGPMIALLDSQHCR